MNRKIPKITVNLIEDLPREKDLPPIKKDPELTPTDFMQTSYNPKNTIEKWIILSIIIIGLIVFLLGTLR